MKSSNKLARLVFTLLASAIITLAAQAKQGATDPIPGTSNGAANSKSAASTGGGKKSVISTPTRAPVVLPPAPPPAPFVAVPLTFTSVAAVNGTNPVCTGDYHIDPYYPTLSLMTVNVETTSVNAPDGSTLHVSVTGTGGTLYPFTSNVIYIAGQTGLCSYSVYVTPGTVITGVQISDSTGRVIAAGR